MVINNILTFDIEDNFTFEELAEPQLWAKYEGQVVDNTNRILDLLNKYNVRATFFVLGKVAERRPEVVATIFREGHEIASHGYIHQKVNVLGEEGFLEDIVRSKKVIEGLTGQTLKGFRAMAFSIDSKTSWAIDLLKDQGFIYDSSMLSSYFEKHRDSFLHIIRDSFVEIPPSANNILGRDVAFGGGIFFRLAPLRAIRYLMKAENAKSRPAILYAHAWEFNKDQPKRKVSLAQSIAQSSKTFTTAHRLEILFHEFSFTSIENYIAGAK